MNKWRNSKAAVGKFLIVIFVVLLVFLFLWKGGALPTEG